MPNGAWELGLAWVTILGFTPRNIKYDSAVLSSARPCFWTSPALPRVLAVLFRVKFGESISASLSVKQNFNPLYKNLTDSTGL